MKRMLALTATAACALAVGVADGSSNGTTLVVDDDRQQCRNADFTTIGAAVAAASPGDEIRVCGGLYNESVVVTKPNLTLRAHDAARGGCFDPAAPVLDPTREAIVSAGPAAAFTLAADGVTLDGFVVRSSNPAVTTSPGFSGYRVERNLILGNVVGLGLASSGAEETRIAHNCFRDNGPAGAVLALALVGGPFVGARIDHNEFFRNAFGVRMGASRDVTIDHNASLADGTWMRNGGVVDVAVVHNEVGAGPGPGIVFFPFGGQAGGAPNADVTIAHNRITGRGSDGFQGLAGLSLVSSLIAHNEIGDNGRDGIRIEAGANGGNVVEHNALKGNAGHDCHDDTAGAGTGGGTANTWEKNDGETQNRPGLCRGATVVPGAN